ncbi:MAG: hypothetical protein O3A00_22580 [Planctomycetota bacterium]|nr:hypothetical protein [Planctomycetota bacterium]
MSLRVCALVALVLPSTATAQWYSNPISNPGVPQFASQQPQCGCVQPVVQYRTVPVTEYQQVKQTVRRPVVETNYEERPVTAYRPVTETRTAEVPTVSYENVTEYRTVQHNTGQWQTQYQPVPRVAPCQYDGRPGLLGWLNRTGYSMRMAVTPKYVVNREYVPQSCTQTVPVTRSVAIRGSRQVAYNVTKMVAYQTTRKVAVNTVRYVDEEVTTMRPVTVMRTVPAGSSLAYLPLSATATATALRAIPDSISNAKANSNRTAESQDKLGRETPLNNRESSLFDSGKPDDLKTKRSAFKFPAPDTLPPSGSEQLAPTTSRTLPSVVRVSGWVARGTSPRRSISQSSGPTLAAPALAVVDAH